MTGFMYMSDHMLCVHPNEIDIKSAMEKSAEKNTETSSGDKKWNQVTYVVVLAGYMLAGPTIFY